MRSMPPLELADLDAQPFRFAASAVLDADPAAVFAELADPSLWFPMMTRSRWRTGATSGVAAEREVHVRLFGDFRERMLAWEPGRRVAFTMLATTSPFVAQMAEDWQLAREGIGTRVEWIVAATPTAIGRPVVPALRGALRAMFWLACTSLGKRAGSYVRERGTQMS